MKVTAERVPDSQVVLEIEVEPERVQRSLDQAYRRLASRARIPGFRPGKAPRHLVERTLGTELLMQEALDRLVPEVYREAVEQEDIPAIARPELEITNLDPVRVRATVPVRPTVDLGAFRDIRVARQPIAVPEGALEAAMEEWRRRVAAWEPVDRGVETGDLVRARLEVLFDHGGDPFRQEDAEFIVRDELAQSFPGLPEGILGAVKDEERTFTAAVPETFRDPALHGATATYTVRIDEIKELKLPELDDEFAKSAGPGFDTLDEFRSWLSGELLRRAEEAEQHRLEEAALDEAVKVASIEFPQVLVEHEVEHILRDQLGPQANERTMERFFRQIGRTEAEVRQELTPAAVERVKRGLVVSELVSMLEVTVDDGETDAELDRIAGAAEGLRRALDTPQYREQLSRSLTTRKALQGLVEIVAFDPPAEPEAPGATPKKPRTAAKKPASRARSKKTESAE